VRAMANERSEGNVNLRLELEHDCDRKTLEELSIEVLEAVERHAADIALGPVSGAHFDPPVIELDFTVIAASRSEVQQIAARVMQIIEQHTSIACVVGTSVAQRELVPA